jgi:hypothetical protein
MELNSVNAACHASLDIQNVGITFIGGTADIGNTPTPGQEATVSPSCGGSPLPLAMTATGDRVWIV